MRILPISRFLSLIGLFALLTIGAGVAHAQSQLNPDACTTGFSKMQEAAISVTSATTTQLVSPVNGQGIYVCGLQLNSVGGTSTFEYGTGAACTGTNAVTGPLAASSTQSIFPGQPRTLFYAPSASTGNGLCIVSGTSTSATNGWLLYVQQ